MFLPLSARGSRRPGSRAASRSPSVTPSTMFAISDAREAVQRAVLPAVGRPRDDDVAVLLLDDDVAARRARRVRPCGPLTRTSSGSICTSTPVGHGDRLLADPAHPLPDVRHDFAADALAGAPRGRS